MFSFLLLIVLPYLISVGSLGTSELAVIVVAITYTAYCGVCYLTDTIDRKRIEAYEDIMEDEEL